MAMLSRAFSKHAQLRDSYIAISNYVRGRPSHPPRKLRRDFSCQKFVRNIYTQQTNGEFQKDIPSLVPKEPLASQFSQYKDICELAKLCQVAERRADTQKFSFLNQQPCGRYGIYGQIKNPQFLATSHPCGVGDQIWILWTWWIHS